MPKKLPLFLLDREPELMLRATRTERERVIGMTLLYTGLRAAELTALRAEHLDFDRRLLAVRSGKGARDRFVPIPKKLLGPLRGWLGPRLDGWVFPSRQTRGRMTVRSLQLMVKRWALRARLTKATEVRAVTPHKFRHAYLSRLLESGATIHEVQRLAGHQDLATTSIYIHCMNDDRLRDAVDRL